MIRCVCGLVEKTQNAISALQDQQFQEVNMTAAKQLLEEAANATSAMKKVKVAALESMSQEARKNGQLSDKEVNDF